MTKDEKKISLENCDFNKKKMRINSPFSLAACELIGIDENDLIYITKDEYIRNNQDCQNIKKTLQEERYNHFNSKRLELIELAKKKRKELIQESKELNKKNTECDNLQSSENNTNINKNTGYTTFYTKRETMKKSSSMGMMGMTSTGFKGGWGASTAIKEERERLKKLKERQETNIRLQIDYECAMEKKKKKNIEKMKLKEEKKKKKRICWKKN